SVHQSKKPPNQGGFVVSVEKTEEIVRKSGMFFVAKKQASTHHVSPHISPRSHHKNTTFCTRFLQNPPQKRQQKQQNPGWRRGLIFLKTCAKKLSLLWQEPFS